MTLGTTAATDSAGTGREHSGRNPYLMLAVVLSATFMLLVDVSIVNVAIPAIQRDLHASDAAIQLVLAGYALAFAVVLITGARLGDIYGRRRLFLIGVVGFTASSAACGAAPGPGALVVARALQGLFGGLLMPQVLSVIQVVFPPRERGRALGVFGATIGLATILGPVLGGALIAWNVAGLDWRLIFFVNVPVGLLAVLGAVLLLPESRAPDAARLDVVGTALVTTGLFLVVYPLVEGRQQGWPAWLLGLLGAAVPVLAAFSAYEVRRTREERSPLVHMSLFGDRAFSAGMVLILVFMTGLPAFFFTIALYLQIGHGFTPLHSGLTVLPFAVGNVIGSVLSHRLTVRLGRAVLSVGTFGLAIGMTGVLLTVLRIHGDVHALQLTPALLVSGLGLGLFIAPVTNIVLAGIHSRAAGAASGVLSAVQQVGASLGIAIVGVIFFGGLSAGAGTATASASAQLTPRLRAAGVSSAQAAAIDRGFATCFQARMKASDPSQTPAVCRRVQQRLATTSSPQTAARVAAIVRHDATPIAVHVAFRQAELRTLGYEICVFALSFVTVLALPRLTTGSAQRRPASASQ